MPRRALILLVACVVAAALAAGARADADPASDFLVQTDVFYPFGQKVSGNEKASLDAAVASGKTHRFRMKVAIIAEPTDLGGVSVLYKKPQQYAKFLSQELWYVSDARVLVVMPNGLGLWRRGGKVSAGDLAAVRKQPPPGTTSGNALAQAADSATRRLLGLHGVPVAPPPKSTTSSDRLTIIIVVLAVLALLAGFVGFRRRIWSPRAS